MKYLKLFHFVKMEIRKDINIYWIQQEKLILEKSPEEVKKCEEEKLCVVCHCLKRYCNCNYELHIVTHCYQHPLRFINRKFLSVDITLDDKRKDKKCIANTKDGKRCKNWAIPPINFCGVHYKKNDYISNFPNAIGLCKKAIMLYKRETRTFPEKVYLHLCDGGTGIVFSIHYNKFDFLNDRRSEFPEKIFRSAMRLISEDRNITMKILNDFLGNDVDGLIYEYYED